MDSIHKYNKKGELVKPWEDGYYSVTTILDVRHNPKLWAWKLNVGWEEANKVMERTRDLGREVHKAIEEYLKGEKSVEVSMDASDVRPYFRGYQNWEKEFDPLTTFVEHYVHSEKYKYAGTVDQICKFRSHWWIIDYKTGSKKPEHGLQLAAYRQAYKEMLGITCRTACLYLTDKTKKGWQFVEYKEPVNVFLAHKKIFDWQLKHEPHVEPKPQYTGGVIYADGN